MSNATKQKIAFYRKLYLAHLIESEKQSVPSLEARTGMPRRTIQDCLKTLADIDIQCEFVPEVGARNNTGYYRILSWGPIRPEWVKENIERVTAALTPAKAGGTDEQEQNG